jgi:hypothetical protein
VSFSWSGFGEVWKHKFVEGLCEEETKSVKSAETS